MGIQSMVTHGAGGGGGGKQLHPQSETLSREGSLYGLTLNDVQNQLGEPLSSMNLDELLRNVLPPGGEQTLAVDLQSTGQFGSSSVLQSQGSVGLDRALRKKTVDEVWLDIQQGQGKGDGETRLDPERQATLGEMTLEDFLVKAGVVVEDTEKKRTSNLSSTGSTDRPAGTSGYSKGAHWLQAYHQQQPQQSVMPMYAAGHSAPPPPITIQEPGYSDPQLTISSPTMGAFSDTQTPGSKRGPSDDVGGKTVERRQKRMIKNRESAARSRARKQVDYLYLFFRPIYVIQLSILGIPLRNICASSWPGLYQ